jgi:outer membrane protein assembly factor BamB
MPRKPPLRLLYSVLISLAAFPATAAAQIDAHSAWPMFHRGPEHSGNNPAETVLNPSNVGGMSVRWKRHTGPVVDSSPAVVNGVVYIGSSDNKLYAFNAATGHPLWTATAGGFLTSPAWADGIVYVASSDYNLYAYEATTGQPMWTTALSGVGSSPTIANSVIYVGASVKDGDGDNYMYAVDPATGQVLWTAGPFGFATPNYALSAAVDGENLYFSFYNLFLWLFNVNGQGELAQGISCTSSPAVANGLVYVGWDGSIAAINASAFGITWSAGTSGTVFSSPAVANGVVYAGSDDGNLYAVNAANGQQLWSAATSGPVRSSPAVANGVVYVGSNDGHLYAFDASSGAQLWSGATGGNVESSPAVVDGVVYVGSADGYLYAFSLPVVGAGAR